MTNQSYGLCELCEQELHTQIEGDFGYHYECSEAVLDSWRRPQFDTHDFRYFDTV